MSQEQMIWVEDLQVVFDTPFGPSQALRGVTFGIKPGEIYGVVGESGCGKSMTARAILGIVPHPGRVSKGRILFDGQNLLNLSAEQMQKIRGARIGMIFQNPKQALNPVFTIGQQLIGVMKHHKIADSKKGLKDRAFQYLDEVGLPATDRILNSYPHQLSGGQLQRAMIAMALSTEPEMLIADEPTTALDVTIQAQILDLLYRLRDDRGLTIMLITHDMGVVAEMCDYVAVFYAGRVVEQGHVKDIFTTPKHPYTLGLLAALPRPDHRGLDLNTIPGSVPGGLTPIAGCAFASRCDLVMDICRQEPPPWIEFKSSQAGSDGQYVACFAHREQGQEVLV